MTDLLDVQRLSDEINRLLTRYCRAVDTKDWSLYRSLFTDDARIDYTSAGAVAGSRDEVTDWLAAGFGAIPCSMHYITDIECDFGPGGDTAMARAMFYNPMRLPGMIETSSCGGYYHRQLVRTGNGWRSRDVREENLWFVNAPS